MNHSRSLFRTWSGAIVVLFVVVLLAGCSGKKTVEPVPVGEMLDYRDAAIGFHLAYPKGWIQDAEVGTRARFFNAPEVDKKFLDPTGPYPDGVTINVELTRTTSPDSVWKAQIGEMNKMGFVIAPEEPATLAGKKAVKVSYSGAYTNKVKEAGYHIFFNADTLLYDIRFAGFGSYFEAYKAVFDASLTSFELPKPVEKGRDQTLPSDATSEYATPLFSFQYPDNYNFETIPKGNNELAISLRGANKSCSIQFTVFPAKGLTLEKVFDQNKGKFVAASAGKATVGNQPAMTLTYPATKDVERRFYFVVKNDKVVRITLDWFKPQRTEYLAAYDKVINSVRFK
jgi:hypothetical protein